jgi:hypothetical protein
MAVDQKASQTIGSVWFTRSELTVIAVICGCSAYLAWKVVLPSAHNSHYSMMCVSRLKQQAAAFGAYCIDFDERLPIKGNVWMDAIGRYVQKRTDVESPTDSMCYCPQPGLGGRARYGYAANIHLLGKTKKGVGNPETMPLVFDSTLLTKNSESGLETLPYPGRHGNSHIHDRNNVAYLDGHAMPIEDNAPRPNDDAMAKR